MDPLSSSKPLLGRFLIEGQIGRGGMGEVFRATDQRTGQAVAIKTLRIDGEPDTNSESQLRRSLIQRFKREYRVASRLDHPGCVRSHLLATVDRELLFVMDYCGGPSLRAFTRARTLTIADALELGLQLLDGLDYIHSRNIVHRDLKPANLLLDAPWDELTGNPPPRLRITDFGIARIGDLNDERQVGQILGTNAYLAPECILGAPSDPRVDLYAFGIILYELLTGTHPLSGPERRMEPEAWLEAQVSAVPHSARGRVPEIPPDLDGLLLDLLEKDPNRRPRTAALVHDALMQLGERHRLLRPEPPPTRPSRVLEGSPYIASPRFVGRRRELQTAQDFLHEAFSPDAVRPARALVVEGEAGAGKSRLLEELFTADRRPRTLVGQCRPHDARLFECMSGLIEALIPVHLARSAPDETRPLTAPLDAPTQALGSPEVPRTATGLLQQAWSDRRDFERLKLNLGDAFLELSRRRPVLVVIEDAQWMDLESLDLLAYLMKRLRDEEHERRQALPAAFVITARPANDENHTRVVKERIASSLDALRVVELPSVDEEHAEELVRHMLMLARSEDPKPFIRRVLQGRSGSPLFLIQMLQLLLLSGELTRGQIDGRGRWNGRWNLRLEPGAFDRIPRTLQDAIGERAARLSVETHALLEVAAVSETRLELELIGTVLGLHRTQVRDLVDEASEAGFLLFEQDGDSAATVAPLRERILETTEDDPSVRDTVRLRFTYDRYREVIYGGLPADRRRNLHRRIAEAIEATWVGRPDGSAELARHFHLGGDPARAWLHGVAAAHHAMQNGAVFHAADAMDLALRAAAEAGIEVPACELEFYADLCVQSGRFDRASATLDQCAVSASSPADKLRILGKRSECNLRKGDFVRAAKPLEDLLASLGEAVPAPGAGYIGRLAWNLVRVVGIGLLPFLRRTTPASGARAERDGLAARAWQKLGEVYAYMSPVHSLFALSRGAILGARLGPGPITASCFSVVGYAAAAIGLGVLARPYIRLARAWVHHQPPQDRAFALAMCVGESIFAGRVASEIELVHQAVDAALQARDVSRTSFGLVFSEAALRSIGQFDSARALAQSVRRIGELSGHDQLASYGPMFSALSGLATGEVPPDQEAVFERAARSAAARGDVLMELVARIHLPLALARRDPSFVPRLDELLELGERWLGGRYVTASASATSALLAGLVYAVLRSSPDPARVDRVLKFAARAVRTCEAQAHEAPLLHGALAALHAWRGRTAQAEHALKRCARVMASTHAYFARGLVDALLAEVGPAWQDRAQRVLPIDASGAEHTQAVLSRIHSQLEGLSI